MIDILEIFAEAQTLYRAHEVPIHLRVYVRPQKPHNTRTAEGRRHRGSKPRRRVFVAREGGAKVLLTDACKRAGVSPGTVRQRLMLGWSMERALGTPVRPPKVR